MSNKRKLRRAQGHSPNTAARAAPSRDALQRQTAAERFSKAGSDKLWLALLGWEPDRAARVWLAQAVNDGVRTTGATPIDALSKHAPQAAAKLDAETVESAMEIWLASGDDYDASDPSPRWHFLSNLASKLDLGSTTPEAYQDDWEAWCGLTSASAPRALLMSSLAQTEAAAVALGNVTRSARIAGLVNLSRAMWTAVAYGDDATFDHLERAGTDWLANIAGKIRPG